MESSCSYSHLPSHGELDFGKQCKTVRAVEGRIAGCIVKSTYTKARIWNDISYGPLE